MTPTPVLEARDLRHAFPRPAGLFGRPGSPSAVLDGVSLCLFPGEVVALVGESGAGKTTLARILLGLQAPLQGGVFLEGQDLFALEGTARQRARRRVQMVFQDPYDALPPRMTVRRIVEEPLLIHRLAPDPRDRLERVGRALEEAGLSPAADWLGHRSAQLSGGQRQRLALASALVVEPAVLLADEPVAMLDVSLKAGILALLSDLAHRRRMAVLLVTHDLASIAHFTDRVAVLYRGRTVEEGPTRQVVVHPAHPYTRALLAAIPLPVPGAQSGPLQGPWDAATPPPGRGCAYRQRCPLAVERCAREDPPLRPVAPGRRSACWRDLEG